MTNPTSSSRPTVQVSTAPSVAGADAEPTAETALPGGTLEHTMAKISLQLEESADRASQLARRERASRRKHRKAERREQLRAAKMRLAGAVVEAGAKAASSAATITGVSTNNTDLGKAYGEGAAAEGQLTRAAIDHFATRADIAAGAHSDAAEAAGDRASDARSAEEQFRGFSEKAQRHMDAVSEATHQARMEIARSVRG